MTDSQLATASRARAPQISWAWLVLGATCFAFVGWRFNVPLAAWLAPLFLVRFFRDQVRWPTTLAAIPLLAVASFVQMNGGWDLETWMLVAVCILRPSALLAAAWMDRALRHRLPRAAATLVYPSVALALDYAISATPLGSGMALSATQMGVPVIALLSSITGIWGIGFLQGWTASVLNTLWEDRTVPRRPRGLALAWVLVMAAVLVYGGARFALARPSSTTVRVGSITVAHPRDYWAWIDAATPRDLVASYEAELSGVEEALFEQSEKAVAAGAKVIFWSEGNGVIPEDRESAFVQRAASFARDHGVYFAPAVVVLHYGSTLSDNKLLMFTPSGSLAFTYVKTMSWYPTGSDGILKIVDTPFGRIGAAICFDMDFPGFIHRLAVERADIVLVPAFDRPRIRPYHTEVGLFRALENGFSVVRQTNEGTSMAMDGSGRVLAQQDFYATSDRLMLSDVPTRRIPTVDALLGDWFAVAGMILAAALVVAGIIRRPAGGRR